MAPSHGYVCSKCDANYRERPDVYRKFIPASFAAVIRHIEYKHPGDGTVTVLRVRQRPK